MNVQPSDVLKKLSDKSENDIDLDFENDIDHPLMIITKGPNYSVTRDFLNSMQRDMDFAK